MKTYSKNLSELREIIQTINKPILTSNPSSMIVGDKNSNVSNESKDFIFQQNRTVLFTIRSVLRTYIRVMAYQNQYEEMLQTTHLLLEVMRDIETYDPLSSEFQFIYIRSIVELLSKIRQESPYEVTQEIDAILIDIKNDINKLTEAYSIALKITLINEYPFIPEKNQDCLNEWRRFTNLLNEKNLYNFATFSASTRQSEYDFKISLSENHSFDHILQKKKFYVNLIIDCVNLINNIDSMIQDEIAD